MSIMNRLDLHIQINTANRKSYLTVKDEINLLFHGIFERDDLSPDSKQVWDSFCAQENMLNRCEINYDNTNLINR